MPGNKTQFSPTFPGFPGGAMAFTNSDTSDLLLISTIYVGGAGDVKVTTAQGDEVVFVGAQSGQVLPVQVKRVWATGTTATNLLAVY